MPVVRSTREEDAMFKPKVVALGSLVGVALAVAPVSAALADQPFRGGHWGHGGNWSSGGHWGGGHRYGGYVVYGGRGYGGYGCYGCLWPLGVAAGVVGTAGAVVGTAAAAVVNTAAAVVTAPFAALAAAANAPCYYGPYYGSSPYAAPPVAYDHAPPAYYGAPAAPAYYAPPARYYYVPPGAPTYSAPPAAGAYYRPAAPAYYDGQAYAAPRPTLAPPPDYYPRASPAPHYSYDSGYQR
jgi:hypothetical protein